MSAKEHLDWNMMQEHIVGWHSNCKDVDVLCDALEVVCSAIDKDISVPFLIKLSQEEDAMKRRTAAMTFQFMECKGATSKMMEDPDASVRLAAFMSFSACLKRSRTQGVCEQLVKPLSTMLEDTDATVRLAALKFLDRTDGVPKQLVEPLSTMLEDTDCEIGSPRMLKHAAWMLT